MAGQEGIRQKISRTLPRGLIELQEVSKLSRKTQGLQKSLMQALTSEPIDLTALLFAQTCKEKLIT